MLLRAVGTPLEMSDIPIPTPGAEEVLLRVLACGVCRTDLHIVDGELKEPRLPLVPGHQIVGVVVERGRAVWRFAPGDHVGVPWLGGTCGTCGYCRKGAENLCEQAIFTGYTRNGGFAEFVCAHQEFCFPISNAVSAAEAAPLLCAGLIGFRAYMIAGDAETIGFYGFGSAAHILCQLAVHQGRRVFAFTRRGDTVGQGFARRLGAVWAGNADEMPPELLDAAIIFAPVGELLPRSLRALKRGGKAICAGIHMSDIPSFPYELLWHERSIHSVANLTRRDGEVFLKLAAEVPVKTTVVKYSLANTNQALNDLRRGALNGTAVVLPEQ